MRLALDNHYSPRIASQLRELGFDVIAIVEEGWAGEGEEALLESCRQGGRALVTNDVADFTAIARRWAVEGRVHSGLIFTSDSSMPRSRKTIGRYVDALAALLGSHPADDALAERIQWL